MKLFIYYKGQRKADIFEDCLCYNCGVVDRPLVTFRINESAAKEILEYHREGGYIGHGITLQCSGIEIGKFGGLNKLETANIIISVSDAKFIDTDPTDVLPGDMGIFLSDDNSYPINNCFYSTQSFSNDGSVSNSISIVYSGDIVWHDNTYYAFNDMGWRSISPACAYSQPGYESLSKKIG